MKANAGSIYIAADITKRHNITFMEGNKYSGNGLWDDWMCNQSCTQRYEAKISTRIEKAQQLWRTMMERVVVAEETKMVAFQDFSTKLLQILQAVLQPSS